MCKLEEKKQATTLWNRALERYRDELEENSDYQDIIENGSLDSLLRHAESIKPLIPEQRSALVSLNRLGPVLKFVDDFSAVVALSVGADAKLTALVWGSIRLILTLASTGGEALQDVVEMLEELSLTLPRFRDYERNLPMEKSFEIALLDVYTESICFYARTIHFFRGKPHEILRRKAWTEFRGDFDRTIRRMKRLSNFVESEAEQARMRVEKGKYSEVLDLIKDLKDNKIGEQPLVRVHQIPQEEHTGQFWAREDVLDAISDALDQQISSGSMRTFALYGMGGVGKTRIALHYASNSRQKFSTILWISADNAISMDQSFRESAKLLNLSITDQEKEDSAAATMKVKSWLDKSNSPWLVIFDNADDLATIKYAWPTNSQGSILVTSRDSQSANTVATKGFHIKPFDYESGSKALLQAIGLEHSVSNSGRAVEISIALGGLPLAIKQIGNFIAQRKIPLRDFLPLYERNAAKIDARRSGLSGSDHTLSTVWELSLSRLQGTSKHLQYLLAFLDPDGIDEQILINGAHLVEDSGFEFLGDEFDLGDAEEPLLQASLIEKSIDTGVLSMHRLVQSAIIRRLSDEDRARYFEICVQLLTWGFPDHWRDDQGHQFQTWSKCELCLPHVHNLVKQADYYKIVSPHRQLYSELLLRSAWYLYEREEYHIARNFVDVALAAFPDQSSLAFASAIDLSGLIDLDMSKPTKALGYFEQALRVRNIRSDPNDPFIAFSLNNIALAQTEIPDLPAAFESHDKAIKIRLSLNSDRIGNSYSNLASLLLRMERPDDAEATLKKCPALIDFSDETFLATGNPRFSGDMVLLSRIRRRQKRPEEALRLASKALAFRRSLLGNRYKTCDSLHDVASMLNDVGKCSSAIELLEELVNLAASLPQGGGQLARAHYTLSCIYARQNRHQQSAEHEALAIQARAQFRPEAADDAFSETGFMTLCPWMLW